MVASVGGKGFDSEDGAVGRRAGSDGAESGDSNLCDGVISIAL